MQQQDRRTTVRQNGRDEDALMARLGYRPELRRAIGKFASFSVAFALISATTAVLSTFGLGLVTAGPAFLWTFPIALFILGCWVVIAADLAAKIPLSGYAYQWTTRLTGPTLGWFTGFSGVVTFVMGMTAVAFSLSGYLADLVGLPVTAGTRVILTILVVTAAAAINIGGVRLATRLNNVGVSLELIVVIGGTVVMAVVALVIHRAPHDLSFLFSHGTAPSKSYALAWLTGTLAPLYGLLGVEAAADVSEETVDARRVIPRTMFLALGSAAIAEFAMYVVFLLAVPDIDKATRNALPLIYVMQEHLGTGFTKVFLVLAITNVFVCVMANMLVGARLVFAMARDRMLPASRFLATVSPGSRVPAKATITVSVLSFLFVAISLISEDAVNYVLGSASLAYFVVYVLTATGLLRADRAGRIPTSVDGGFDLGRLRRSAYWIGACVFTVTVLALALLPDFRENGVTMLVLLVLAALWWALVLRRRLARGAAGPARSTDTADDS